MSRNTPSWLNKVKVFRRFDSRLSAELRRQRKPIVAGLICVVVTALLTTTTIPLIKWSLQAINDAGHIGEQMIVTKDELQEIARAVHKSPVEVNQVFVGIEQGREDRLRKSEFEPAAKRLGVTPDRLNEIMDQARDHAMHHARNPQDALSFLGLICIAVVSLYGLKYWFTRGQAYYLSYASNRLANDLRMQMFAKLQRLPVSYFNEKRAGAIQSVLTNDVNVYQNAVMVIRDSIDAPIRALGSFVYVFVLQWQLGLVTLLFLPVLLVVIQRNARKMKKAQSQVQIDLSHLNALSQESLLGTRVVKAFNAETTVLKNYGGLVERSFDSQMTAVRRLATLRPLVELIGAGALATVMYICGWLAYGGSLQVADIAALVYALDLINQGFRSLGNVQNTYSQVEAASERIYSEILDVPDEHFEYPGTRAVEQPKGRIAFEHVTFSYPDGTAALCDVSFVIEPGTSLALVGPSGAGKSTVADLVLRFYDPTSGRITFDGVDLKELKVEWLRSQIGVVPQSTFLFAGTIAENIRMGAPDATMEEVVEAGKMAHAEEFVNRFEGKYDANIGELGMGLSGGERQRVAIARALVRKPTMLLLDEATSALDATSEKAVTAALEEVMQTRTTIFIAHRLTTAARADKILYLRRGEVVEYGSHKELMDAGGEYAALFRVFSSGLLEDIQ
ncbi:MAG TPA: ABC transporter ATP-binding protein [Fimbriimonadaceae bacterium]|nr:ABC transporter ATP-binding protein [Fimbriimonadaceae bacterium]